MGGRCFAAADDRGFLVVFSGATIDTETRYSLGIGVEADEDFSSFFETGRYEPNNTEDGAHSMNAQKIIAYLYKNDIDYYRVSYGAVNFPSAPANVSVSATGADVTVSWTAVSGASSYNIYRSVGSIDSAGAYVKAGASSSPSYIETVAGTGTYYYVIRAVDAGGVEGAHSVPMAVAVTVSTMEIDVANLSDTLSWLAANAVNSSHYTLSLTRNETISAQTFSYSGKNISITLDGGTVERTVSLSSNGSLFTVENGVTLTLGNDITLRGRTSNTISLVQVNSGGTLVMNAGSKVTGNTRTSGHSGGVYVNGGTFTMTGGTVSGNTVFGSSGGGVGVWDNGTFMMSGGNTASNTSNSTYARGGVVYVGSGGTFTKQSGGIIYGSNASASLKNTARDGDSYGHAVYAYISSSSIRKRNSTAGVGVTLNSAKDASGGGCD